MSNTFGVDYAVSAQILSSFRQRIKTFCKGSTGFHGCSVVETSQKTILTLIVTSRSIAYKSDIYMYDTAILSLCLSSVKLVIFIETPELSSTYSI